MAVQIQTLAQLVLFLAMVVALVKPVGTYMARVFSGERTFMDAALRPFERLIYRLTRIDASREMTWSEYAVAFTLFSLIGTLILYALLRLQSRLPFADPANLTTLMTPDLAANTAVSFSTTTTWQAYAG